ncbi:YdeI/OmpD-associated family protein [Sphingomonas donggukensis]|uniref:YdeI/OmpD-associated family protein n=1 Tax=Sphingomonas donggukensis TaxID=2949093 RepID=A0ABY4TW16_9SPHN|nr:YdeI/OmpD-associated family protein [Sphingomonas donggukensis]URW74518.1 YdeI/OmpD-associated family protein [Sphingomonas donggukensis]
MPTDPRIDAYIDARADFAQSILAWLRQRVHAACPEVEEAIKWSMPAFLYRGRPLANMAAFKGHATFGFWDRQALATGMEGEAMGQYGRIERLSDLPPAEVVEDQVRAAMARIDSGAKPARAARTPKPEAVVPPALATALAGDAAAAATFHAFPPSCRRDYCEWIAEAKRADTRDRRVADAVAWLREGKRRHWKHESC